MLQIRCAQLYEEIARRIRDGCCASNAVQMLNAQLAALSFGVYRAAFDIHLFAYAVRATVHRAADAAHAGGLLP